MENNSHSPGCLAWLAILLTVLFVGLKLTGYINWAWIWVVSPILIDMLILALAVFILIITKSFE